MRTLISFRYSGGDKEEIRKLLTAAREALQDVGVETFCTFFDVKPVAGKPKLTPREFMHEAFAEIDQSDFLFVLQASEERSEGMLLEVGYCLANKVPVVVATQDDVKATYLPSFAAMALRWTDYDDLARVIRGADFASLKLNRAL